jgi:hypothetical protein
VPAPQASLNGTYDQVVFSQRAAEIIHSHDKTDPLYVYLAYHNVHDACIADRFSGGAGNTFTFWKPFLDFKTIYFT